MRRPISNLLLRHRQARLERVELSEVEPTEFEMLRDRNIGLVYKALSYYTVFYTGTERRPIRPSVVTGPCQEASLANFLAIDGVHGCVLELNCTLVLLSLC